MFIISVVCTGPTPLPGHPTPLPPPLPPRAFRWMTWRMNCSSGGHGLLPGGVRRKNLLVFYPAHGTNTPPSEGDDYLNGCPYHLSSPLQRIHVDNRDVKMKRFRQRV